MKKSIILSTAVAAALSSSAAFAELTANATATTNYLWRGVTQTSDAAAVQGGIDYGHDSGLYVGTWVSNVDFDGTGTSGYEQDIYAGFGGEAGGFAYDLGAIWIMFPTAPETNFTELYASGTFNVVTLGVAYTIDTASANEAAAAQFDKGDLYIFGSLDFETGAGDVSLYGGSYQFTNDGTTTGGDLNYWNVGASISKGGFSLAFEKTDDKGFVTDGHTRAVVSYSVDFELM